MKIQTLALCALTLALATACGEKKCNVTGTVEGLDDAKGLFVTIGEANGNIDTLVVTGGKFSYQCPVDETVFLTVKAIFDGQTREQSVYTRFVPDAPRVTITLKQDESEVAGSPITDAYHQFAEKINKVEDDEEYYALFKENYLQNAQNAFGTTLFSSLAYDLTLEEFDEYFEKGNAKIKEDKRYDKIREAKVNEAKTCPGTEYVDFSGKTPEGKDVKLSDFVGKGNYTLVDFWASWCGPCMRSMPGMVNLWNTYHKKGLDIVGVAVWDGDNSASRDKITEKGMLWPQIFAGEDKTPTDVYGILGIPHVILFDPEGIIIQRGIPNEEQLAEKIADLLK